MPSRRAGELARITRKDARRVEVILGESVRIVRAAPEGESIRCLFQAPVAVSRFIASKGSVALDGVSLTVNEVEGSRFGVNVIPHTSKVTTFGKLKAGSEVNLEVDLMARYVARLVKA